LAVGQFGLGQDSLFRDPILGFIPTLGPLRVDRLGNRERSAATIAADCHRQTVTCAKLCDRAPCQWHHFCHGEERADLRCRHTLSPGLLHTPSELWDLGS